MDCLTELCFIPMRYRKWHSCNKNNLGPGFSMTSDNNQGYHIIVNSNSGTALKQGEKFFNTLIANTKLPIQSYSFIPPDKMAQRIEDLVKSDFPLLIGGGDGTIAHAAALHLSREKPFGIIPMGTMNLLARDLGIPLIGDQGNIFDLYIRTNIQPIDIGTANDKPFLCCAAIGTIPQAALFRENIRNLPDVVMMPRLTAYIIGQMDKSRMRSLRVLADDKEMALETAALVISNNRFAHSVDADFRLAKNSLQDGMLGIYSAAPQTLRERIRLLFRMQQGKIEAEPSLMKNQARMVIVKTNKSHELVSIDGEPVMMKTPIHFRIRSGALKVLVPVKTDQEAVI